MNKPTEKKVPKIGFCNRKNYNIHIVLKDKDILLAPGKITTRVYMESDIVSVENMTYKKAISLGLISIVR